MLFLIITIFLLLPYCLLLFYYRKSWVDMEEYANDPLPEEALLPFISVIIAARNEEQNIGKCIESILRQTYPSGKFELIIVNDHSTDDTLEVIQSFKKEIISVIDLVDFTKNELLNSYKKKSIETALQFARGEMIMTTDADCLVPEKWIETVAGFYLEKNPVFIASPVVLSPSEKESGNRFLNIFQTLDFMTLQGITGASVYKKFHSMCNGANLAYTKEVFYEVNGFDGIDELASGDDMLLMHKIRLQHPDRVLFLKSREVVVKTGPESTLNKFLGQRIRWASKADKYTDKKIIVVLLLVYLINAWILILGITSFLVDKVFYLFLFSIIIKTTAEYVFLYPVAGFFKKKSLLWWLAPFQPFHILYTLIAGWLGKFGHYSWKERRVK